MIGGDAADRIAGGSGDDSLTGNGGADRFTFFGWQRGDDRITDFAPGEDVVRLVGFGHIDPLAELEAQGGDTVLDLGHGRSITFAGLAPSDFSADDFLLV